MDGMIFFELIGRLVISPGRVLQSKAHSWVPELTWACRRGPKLKPLSFSRVTRFRLFDPSPPDRKAKLTDYLVYRMPIDGFWFDP